MYLTLFRHRWQKTIRSTFFKQGWGVKILLALVALYFLASFGFLGYFLKEILHDSFEDAEKVTPILSGGILFYLLADLVMRFFLQDLNVITVQHYLNLPISKKKIIHFLLQSSIFNFFNLLPLLFLVPWAFRVIPEEYSLMHQIIWPISMLAVIFTNHYLAIYLKRVLAVDAKVFWLITVLLGALYGMHYFEILDLREVSKMMYQPLAESHYLAWWPVALMVIIYLLNYGFLVKMTHLDRWSTKAKEASSFRFAFLENKGPLGLMMANELKLITRNRRTKTALYLSGFFALYGLIFYNQEMYADSYAWLVFVGIFMSGIFMINYGQFLVSWESAYFDGILTRAYSMEEFYRAKYYLMIVSCLVMYLLTIPYVYFGWHALYINTAALLYNIGINSAVLLFASTYNKKPVDLSRGSAFNYQGTGAAQFVIVIPLMVVPLLAFQAFNVFDMPNAGLIFLGGMGILGLLTHRYFIKETIKNFKEKKYINAAGYRERD